MAHGTSGEFPFRESNRRELRQRMRLWRQNLSATDCQRRSRQLALTPLLRKFRGSRRIAAFFGIERELSPIPALLPRMRRGTRVYLPCLRTGDTAMHFVRWRRGQPLRRGRFGIPQPRGRSLSAGRLDLVLMPLLAYDDNGNRLGRGAGIYDRNLARWRRGRRRPRLVGIAYRAQRLGDIPNMPWDLPMDAVLSESGLQFSKRYRRS